MFVESIELNNYRNFDSLKVEFSPERLTGTPSTATPLVLFFFK